MNPKELGQALIAGIAAREADWGEEAAVHLLVANRVWLHRREVRDHVHQDDSATSSTAWLDWSAVAAEPDRSHADRQDVDMLRLACHLAGHLPPRAIELQRWTIAEMLSELDAVAVLLATRAITTAALGPDMVGPLT